MSTAKYETTDSSDLPKQQKSTGRGSKQRRADNYRQKKNVDADAAIQAGIFARLKITDPTLVASAPLAKAAHPVITPVGFTKAPALVDRVWSKMRAIGPRAFSQLDTPINKDIFTKGMLILCEAKLCLAQRRCRDSPDEELESRHLYTEESLNDLASMAAMLPYPMAMYLECLGVVAEGQSSVVPVLTSMSDPGMTPLSGVFTYAPSQLLPLLGLLHSGVPIQAITYQMAQELNGAPGIEWEQFERQAEPPIASARITQQCYEFWIENNNNRPRIRWTDAERMIFISVIQSMTFKRGFIIGFDLLHGDGSLAQIVQTNDWSLTDSTRWFTMCNASDYDIKLGVAFGLAPDSNLSVQESRFRGKYKLSVWRGELTPRRILDAMLAGVPE